MLKDNSKYTLDAQSTLQTQQPHFRPQRFFQDKHKHEELIDIVSRCVIKVKHDEVWKSTQPQTHSNY